MGFGGEDEVGHKCERTRGEPRIRRGCFTDRQPVVEAEGSPTHVGADLLGKARRLVCERLSHPRTRQCALQCQLELGAVDELLHESLELGLELRGDPVRDVVLDRRPCDRFGQRPCERFVHEPFDLGRRKSGLRGALDPLTPFHSGGSARFGTALENGSHPGGPCEEPCGAKRDPPRSDDEA